MIDTSHIGRDCASRKFKEMLKELGKPNILVDERNGYATWTHSSLRKTNYKMFHSIILSDDDGISHTPFEHYASVICNLNYKIPIIKLASILSISENISYDAVIEQLHIRGRNIHDVICLTALTSQILSNTLTIDEIKKNGLVRNYYLAVTEGSKLYNKDMIAKLTYLCWKTFVN